MEATLNKLRYVERIFPRQALLDAMNQKEEITERLLSELDQIIASPQFALEEPDYMLHMYSLYLLAQFKEKRAFRRIIKLVSLPPKDIDELIGDLITEDLGSILYSTFDGDLNLLKSLIENQKADVFVRGTALNVYAKLYSEGVINKIAGIEYLRSLIYADPYPAHQDLATHIMGVVIEQHIFEMIQDIQYLYDKDRVDIMMYGHYDDFIDFIYTNQREVERISYIEDVIDNMYWWPCFEQTDEQKRQNQLKMENLKALLRQEEEFLNQPVAKITKIGRNDPCPCGSGKKYKKCCLGKEPAKEDIPEPLQEQEKWLRYYPDQTIAAKEGEVRLTDHFDQESIEIDRLVYLALHRRNVPLWSNTDESEGIERTRTYLIQAFEKFSEKCRKEEINSFQSYDKKYKIHYRSSDWIKKLQDIIHTTKPENSFKAILKDVSQVIAVFS